MKDNKHQNSGDRPKKQYNSQGDRRFSAQHAIDYLTRSLRRQTPLGVQKPGDLIAAIKLINDLQVDVHLARYSEPDRREVWIGRFEALLTTARGLRASIAALRPTYERVDDTLEFPSNAVFVSIGTEPDLVPIAEPSANVSWAEMIIQGERIAASSEGPYEVPEAFARANGYAAQLGLPRVMVSIGHAASWQSEWGELIDAT